MTSNPNSPTMQQTDPAPVNPDSLVDINHVQLNMDLPQAERVLDYIRQIKNPYLFKCGPLVVKATFAETDTTLTDCLQQCFEQMA